MKQKFLGTKWNLLIVLLFFSFVSCHWDEKTESVNKGCNNSNATEAVQNIEKADAQNIDTVSRGIFGDVKIRSSEYLYNLNDSPDYIYVDFEDYGYVVYFRDTMEMMEYAPLGSLPYQDTRARRYYCGPTNYFNKEDEFFINTVTNESFSITRAEAEAYSWKIVEIF